MFVLLNSCNLSSSQTPPLFNVNTFSGSYRDLVIAIDKEDTASIVKLVKDENLDVNHKDPRYGISLLRWALANRKYYSFQMLLDLNANPNQTDTTKEYVPVTTIAAKIAETSSYLGLVLKHDGNPNIAASNLKKVQYTEATPLCAAASTSLQNVKLLIENGAEIDFCPYSNFLPLTTALIADKIGIARYLIIEKSADVHKVFTVRVNNDTAKIGEMLRLNVYPLESEEYKLKMQIVDFLKTIGIDYRNTPIPKYLYNNYSKDFLDKY